MPLDHLEDDEYRLDCQFTSLKCPNLRHIIKKELVNSNHVIINHANSRASAFEIYLLLGSWRATIGVIARTVIDSIKHDMCSNSNAFTLLPHMLEY